MRTFLIALLLGVSFMGRAPAEEAGPWVYIDAIDVLVLESFPVQIQLHVKGNLANYCLSLVPPVITRQDRMFRVQLNVKSSQGACVQMLRPFEKNIPLDVNGLPAGTYTIDVNGMTETFTLQQDNKL